MKYHFLGLLYILVAYQITPHALGQDFAEIGRSIAGFLSSKFSDLQIDRQNSAQNTKSQTKPSQLNVYDDNHLSTDDLFNGLNQLWSTKNETLKDFARKNSQGNKRQKYSSKNKSTNVDVKKSTNNIIDKKSERLIDKLFEKENKEINGNKKVDINKMKENTSGEHTSKDKKQSNISSNDAPLEEEDHWMRIRTIADNMKSIFLSTYGEDSRDKIEVVTMLDRMLDIGDKINIAQKVKDSFDADLLNFLEDKWLNAKKNVLKDNPLFENMLSVDAKVFLITIARGLVKQFSKAFHKQVLAHVNQQGFVIETMRVSGFKDEEIYEVFHLLDLPTETLISTSKSLHLSQDINNNTVYDMSGRSGGYGGYGSMMKKDPLLLLAGIAFATFAAYVIYRLLSSTPAVARRGFDVSLSLALSDMPEVMNTVYSWLEKADRIYGKQNEDNEVGNEENFTDSINDLWRIYKISEPSGSCVRRYLCHHLKTNMFRILPYGTNLEQIILMALAESMGEIGTSKSIDSFVGKLLKGKDIDCKESTPTCDDILFDSIVNKSGHSKRT